MSLYWAGQLVSHGTGPAESYQTQGCAHICQGPCLLCPPTSISPGITPVAPGSLLGHYSDI